MELESDHAAARPQLCEETEATLQPWDGAVYSIAEVARRWLHLLGANEQAIVCDRLHTLEECVLPACLQRPVARTSPPEVVAGKKVGALRGGARSALLPEWGVKLKGCRPLPPPADFPTEELPFGAEELQYGRIPFGTLSQAGIMREVLGHCFCTAVGLRTSSIPVAVYEYRAEGRAAGYCLVMKTEAEDRIESFIRYPGLRIGDLVTADFLRAKLNLNGTLSQEVPLKGVNVGWWAEAKSAALVQMHFAGGFRGYLNSNLGNDVIEPSSPPRFALCDFDTFHVVPLPEDPSAEFLRAFALHCLADTLKGSLPIVDYVIPSAPREDEVQAELAKVYFERSSLWRAYKRRFDQQVARRGWDEQRVEEALAAACRTPAFATMISDCVLNAPTIRGSKRVQDSMYCSHN